MTFDRARIKENGKKHYELNKWNNVVVMLIATFLGGLGGGSSSLGTSGSTGSVDPKLGAAIALFTIAASVAGLLVGIFLTNIITLGTAGWFRRSIYFDKLDVSEMFAPFKTGYIDNVLTMLLKGIYIFLWTLLLIVPGIVKSYSYAMVEYIKTENPSIPAGKALEMSEKMMEGHKMDLFELDLSFLGWHLLGALTIGILEVIYVGPYCMASRAFAYEEIKADAVEKGRIDPADLVPPEQ